MEDSMTLTNSIRDQAQTAQVLKSRPHWLPHLSLVLLAEMALLLYLLPRDLILMDQLHRAYDSFTRQRRAQSDRRNDPVPGTQVLSSVASPSLKGVMMRGGYAEPTALVFIGPCASCIAKDLSQWQEVAKKYPRARLVFVSRDTRENISRFAKTQKFRLPIVEDPDGAIARSFNATWIPRVYQIDADGRLTWLQTDDSMSPQAIADELWTRRKGGRP